MSDIARTLTSAYRTILHLFRRTCPHANPSVAVAHIALLLLVPAPRCAHSAVAVTHLALVDGLALVSAHREGNNVNTYHAFHKRAGFGVADLDGVGVWKE